MEQLDVVGPQRVAAYLAGADLLSGHAVGGLSGRTRSGSTCTSRHGRKG